MFRVSYNSAMGTYANTFLLHKKDGNQRKFIQSTWGLYYFDVSVNSKKNTFALVNTVAKNVKIYSKKDFKKAYKARNFQHTIGNASTKKTLHILDNHGLKKWPITRKYLRVAEDILGPSIQSLHGKTPRKIPSAVNPPKVSSLPNFIKWKYNIITLCADNMFVNKVQFFITISQHISFGKFEHITNAKTATLVQSLLQVKRLYKRRWFKIQTVMMGGQFYFIKSKADNAGMSVNTTSIDEHEPAIERYIHTIKDRSILVWSTLPFKKVPVRMIIELVAASVFWFHVFPHHDGISTTMSPHEVITGMTLDYNHHCKHQYDDYVQTHDQHYNTMSLRTIGSIALRPTGNEQGGRYCMSLKTGRLLNRNNATPLPMPSKFINHVHRIEHRAPVGLTFADRNNVAFLDISDDDEVFYVYDSDSDKSDNDDDPSKAEDPEEYFEITVVDEQ